MLDALLMPPDVTQAYTALICVLAYQDVRLSTTQQVRYRPQADAAAPLLMLASAAQQAIGEKLGRSGNSVNCWWRVSRSSAAQRPAAAHA